MSINTSQIQIRIDLQTKNQAKKILENLGLDISTAVKMMLRQVVLHKTLPYEIRDINGFTLQKSQELKESIIDVRKNKKTFSSGKSLIKDALL